MSKSCLHDQDWRKMSFQSTASYTPFHTSQASPAIDHEGLDLSMELPYQSALETPLSTVRAQCSPIFRIPQPVLDTPDHDINTPGSAKRRRSSGTSLNDQGLLPPPPPTKKSKEPSKPPTLNEEGILGWHDKLEISGDITKDMLLIPATPDKSGRIPIKGPDGTVIGYINNVTNADPPEPGMCKSKENVNVDKVNKENSTSGAKLNDPRLSGGPKPQLTRIPMPMQTASTRCSPKTSSKPQNVSKQ